jgi:hypothetical protein
MQAAGALGDSKEKVSRIVNPILSANVINQQEKQFKILPPAHPHETGYPSQMGKYKVSDAAASKVTMFRVVCVELPLVMTIRGRIKASTITIQ